jgi:ethanolamine permease
MYAFNRQVFAMSRKGFLPSILSRVHNGVPYAALIFCNVTGLGVSLFMQYITAGYILTIVWHVNFFGTALVYIWIVITFICIRYKFKNQNRPFVSTVGIPGAVAALCVYLVLFVFYCIYSVETIVTSIYVFIALHALWTAYYWFVSRHYLVLDEDEKKAITNGLNVDDILKSEHGYIYIEKHCIQERNPESLYCLVAARELQAMDELSLSLEQLQSFCHKYVC